LTTEKMISEKHMVISLCKHFFDKFADCLASQNRNTVTCTEGKGEDLNEI